MTIVPVIGGVLSIAKVTIGSKSFTAGVHSGEATTKAKEANRNRGKAGERITGVC